MENNVVHMEIGIEKNVWNAQIWIENGVVCVNLTWMTKHAMNVEIWMENDPNEEILDGEICTECEDLDPECSVLDLDPE